MPYRFETEDRDWSDFASGRVLYNLPGAPAFPVRMASEIFLRAARRILPARPLHIYDPVCGAAYHLAAIGFLHGRQIEHISASDIDEHAVSFARRNLGLLTSQGLLEREQDIRRMLAEYGKASHAEALESVGRLHALMTRPVSSHVFTANVLVPSSLAVMQGNPVDLVISDVPYGHLSAWMGADAHSARQPVTLLLEAIHPLLAPGGLVAIAADKAQKITHPAYLRVEHIQIGKRQVSILQPVPATTR